MTLILDDSGLAAAEAEAPAVPDVEAPSERVPDRGTSFSGRLPVAAAASVALHLSIAALFLTGPGRDLASTLLAGVHDDGLAAIGDAKNDNAETGRRSGKDGAISVVLTPPPAPPPTPPKAPAPADPAVAVPKPVVPKPAVPKPPVLEPPVLEKADARKPEAPPLLSAKGAAAEGNGAAAAKPAAPPVQTPAPATPPTPEKRPEAKRPEPKSPEVARTFRQPFLLPQGGGTESWRGALTGSRQGKSVSTTKGKAEKGSGDAAVSSYPGSVARKLGAALRYPAGAKAARLTGEATVHFAVDRSGRATSVSIVASSGFDVLDKAAIAAVGRASPFPPIPAAADRRDWPFTVTLAFGK